MFLEVDFPKPQSVDHVRVEASHDQGKTRVRLEVFENGAWIKIPGDPEITDMPSVGGTRRAATEEMKRAGVRYLLLDERDFGAEDIRENGVKWGWTPIGERAGVTLFKAE
jgi:hypothetical protein